MRRYDKAISLSRRTTVGGRGPKRTRCVAQESGSAPLSLASARVCKHLGPPFIAGRLLRVQPGTVLDGITRLNHGDDQPCDLGPTDIEQDEVRRHGRACGAVRSWAPVPGKSCRAPSMNAAKYSFVRTALSSPNRYLFNSISENSWSGSTAPQRAL